LYPFPEAPLCKQLACYPNADEIVWCQEEPQNQGAWFSIQHHLHATLSDPSQLRYVGRPFSAAPAVGYAWLHLQGQHQLVAEALGNERNT